LSRARDDEMPIPDQIAHGERVAGEVVFNAPCVEAGEFRSYNYDDELARIRQIWAREAAGARASRPSAPTFHVRSLRRLNGVPNAR
jgi:hypothetical protein